MLCVFFPLKNKCVCIFLNCILPNPQFGLKSGTKILFGVNSQCSTFNRMYSWPAPEDVWTYVTPASSFSFASWKSREVETGKSTTFTVVSRIFPTLPLPGWQRLLLARAGHTQHIRMGDLYPYNDETGQEGHMWLKISDLFYLFNVL